MASKKAAAIKAAALRSASRAYGKAVRSSPQYKASQKSSRVRAVNRRASPTASSKNGGGGKGG